MEKMEKMAPKEPKPKKKKLTPAEKKARKAEKKALKILAIAEAKRQVKREYLSRELEFGRRNRRKIDRAWKQTLIDQKVPILRTELQLQINSFDKVLDIKDYTISLLLDDLDIADAQSRFNTQAHCEKVENMIEIFNVRLGELKRSYDDDLHTLLHTNDIDTENVNTRQMAEEGFVKVMIYGLETQGRDMDKTLWSEYLSKLKEEMNKNTDELQKMRGSREHTFEDLWRNFKNTLQNYTNIITERRKEYDIIQKQDIWMRNKIKEQYIQIYDSYEMIKKLKDRQVVNQDKLAAEVRGMDEELEHFSLHFDNMKNANSKNMEFDNQQLMLLVRDSNKAINFLEHLRDKAERILRCINMCRPYETQKEKVLAHPKSLPTLSQEISIPYVPVNYSQIYKELEPFWLKYAKIGCCLRILKEEILAEREKNTNYRNQVDIFCNYALSGDCIKNSNDNAVIRQNIHKVSSLSTVKA